MTRIYERQADALFAKALNSNPAFAAAFLTLIDGAPESRITRLSAQTPHRGAGHRGSIDLEVTRADGAILLVENKIDAGYSVTRGGDPQPDRYRASVAALRARGLPAASVLLAPAVYLAGTRHASAFDHRVSYDAVRPALTGADLALLDAAIAQASTPYDPIPNASSAAFFVDYEAFARKYFPDLVIKHNPNGNGVRQTIRARYISTCRARCVPGLSYRGLGCHCNAGTVPRPRPRSRSCWGAGARVPGVSRRRRA